MQQQMLPQQQQHRARRKASSSSGWPDKLLIMTSSVAVAHVSSWCCDGHGLPARCVLGPTDTHCTLGVQLHRMWQTSTRATRTTLPCFCLHA
jgi:hypothetical protein